jgi:putative membrane protein (TIGR04086 family)
MISMLKSLLASYIATAFFLLFLAFLVYKAGLSERVVSAVIIAIYILATFFGGVLVGKVNRNRKFLWGLLLGGSYFLILVVVSLIVNRSAAEMGSHFFTTMILCCAGGMLGGMLS